MQTADCNVSTFYADTAGLMRVSLAGPGAQAGQLQLHLVDPGIQLHQQE